MNVRTAKGTCEICDAPDVVVYTTKGNIVVCSNCYEKELAAIKSNQAAIVVIESRKIDSMVELSQDVFNNATVGFVELQAAILHDDSIPTDQKDFALVKEAQDRIKKLSEVIFADEKALIDKKNERHAWLINAQNMVPKLRADMRAQFASLDISYKPETPKSVKPKTIKVKTQTFNTSARAELAAACKKYDVPSASVQSIKISRNCSYDDAAKIMSEMMGK